MRSTAAVRSRFAAVLLDGVHDPHNLAAILRTSDAFGFQELHAVEETQRVRISNKVARGTQRWVDLFRYPSATAAATQLRRRGYALWVASAGADSVELRQWSADRPTVFAFGNEHAGIGNALRDQADVIFSVPMFGMVESLNVSVACAVTLAHARRVLASRTDDGRFGLLDENEQTLLVSRWSKAGSKNDPLKREAAI